MDPFSTSVYNSRRPFKIHCPAVLPPPELIDPPKLTRTFTTPSPIQSSSKRRKPSITYHSPCFEHPVRNFTERYSAINLSTTPSTSPPPTTSSDIPPQSYSSPPTSTASPRAESQSSITKTTATRLQFSKPLTSTSIYALAPSLPLYHPLGTLALSLLPLPTSTSSEHHHPTNSPPADIPHASSSRSRQTATSSTRNRTSGRSRKAVAKLRDDDALAAVYAEHSEKEHSGIPTPRRLKPVPASPIDQNGSAPVAVKRKRKDSDDAGSVSAPLLPPPKRLRIPRGSTHGVSPSPSVVLGVQDDPTLDKDEDPPGGPGKPNGRAKRNSRAATGGARRNGGRRGTRKDKEKDKDSSPDDDDEILTSTAVPQVVTFPTKYENTVSVTVIEQLNPHEREERTVLSKT